MTLEFSGFCSTARRWGKGKEERAAKKSCMIEVCTSLSLPRVRPSGRPGLELCVGRRSHHDSFFLARDTSFAPRRWDLGRDAQRHSSYFHQLWHIGTELCESCVYYLKGQVSRQHSVTANRKDV